MITLHVNVANKIATYQKRDGDIVCGNSDYQIKFTFDEEWGAHEQKTARFVWNGQYFDVDFEGDTCTVPIIKNTPKVSVGVYAGQLSTTTAADIWCQLSILCETDNPNPGTGQHYTNEAKAAAEEAKASAEESKNYSLGSKNYFEANKETTGNAIAEALRIYGEIEKQATYSEQAAENASKSERAAMEYESRARSSAESAARAATHAEAVVAGVNEKIERNSKCITNLKQGLPSEQFMTDSTVAHVKDVPVNALPFAEVSKVGGMTRKCRNLIPYPYRLVPTSGGITFVVNSDLSIDVSGTPSQSIYETVATLTLEAGTYCLTNYGTMMSTVRLYATYDDSTIFANDSFTLTKQTSVRIRIAVYDTFDGETVRIIPMFNEGSTALPYEPYYEGLRDAKVTEIESVGKNFAVSTENPSQTNFGITITRIIGASFAVANGTLTEAYALRLFGYFKLPAGTYTASVFNINPTDRIYIGKGSDILANYIQLNSPKTFTLAEEAECFIQIVFEKGSAYNNTEIQVQIERGDTATEYSPYTRNTLPIPEAVRPAHGINENVYDYIEWCEDGTTKSHERVGEVDLGTLNWTYSNAYGTGVMCFRAVFNNVKPISAVTIPNALCALFDTITADAMSRGKEGVTIYGSTTGINICTSQYTDAATFKAAMSGVMLYYELATPEVTDISDLLSADNFLAVEGGGTVTAVNENGLEAPSEITYMLKETTV